MRSGRGPHRARHASSSESTSGSSRSAIAVSAATSACVPARVMPEADGARGRRRPAPGRGSPRSASPSTTALTLGLVIASRPGEQRRPLVARRDEGEDPVLGQGEVAGGALEHPGEEGDRPGGAVQIVHLVSLPNGKASKLPGIVASEPVTQVTDRIGSMVSCVETGRELTMATPKCDPRSGSPASADGVERRDVARRRALLAVFATVPLAAAGFWWFRTEGWVADTPFWMLAVLLVVTAGCNIASIACVAARAGRCRCASRCGSACPRSRRPRSSTRSAGGRCSSSRTASDSRPCSRKQGPRAGVPGSRGASSAWCSARSRSRPGWRRP